MSEVRGSGRECQAETAQERREELPKSKVRGDGWEELPQAPLPETRDSGREELPYARGQGRRPGGPTPSPRSRGCTGAGGPRGAIPVEGQEGQIGRAHV